MHKQRALDFANYIQWGCVLLVAVVITVFSHRLLGHFGKSFVAYAPLLTIYTIGSIIALLPGLSIFGPMIEGYEKVLLIESGSKIFLAIVIGSLSYYFYGLTGIVWSIVLIKNIVSFGLFFYVKARSKLKYMVWA